MQPSALGPSHSLLASEFVGHWRKLGTPPSFCQGLRRAAPRVGRARQELAVVFLFRDCCGRFSSFLPLPCPCDL